MALFTVTFQLQSRYFGKEQYNLVDTIQKEYEVDDLKTLKALLKDPQELASIDDFSVFNSEVPDGPDEVEVIAIRIEDEQGSEL